jgi:cobalt-zinc-cadmium efflux system outer membrane protein
MTGAARSTARISLLLALLAGCAASSEGERAPGPPIAPGPRAPAPQPLGAGTDLNRFREYALAASPDITSPTQRAQLMAIAQARQAGLFPNPVLTYGLFDMPVGTGQQPFAGAKQVVALSQAIPLGPRTSAARAEAEAVAEETSAGIGVARLEFIEKLDDALARYLAARHAERIQKDLAKRLQDFEASVAAKVAAGKARKCDLLATRVEVERAVLEAENAERTRRSTEAVLRRSVGKDFDPKSLTVELPTDAPPIDREAVLDRVARASPSVLLVEQQAVTARATLERARAERFPDMTVLFGGGYRGDRNEAIFESGVAIPIPIFNRNQHNVTAALDEVDRVDRALAGERVLATIAAESALREYEASRARVRRYRERIIPTAREALTESKADLAAGRGTDREVLEAERLLGEVELGEVAARERLALAIAAIERLCPGALPEKP